MSTIRDLITQACERSNEAFNALEGREAEAYWHGRIDGLLLADQCRLTDAERAVIDAALAQTGPRSPRLAMALNALRKERGLETPAQPTHTGTDDPGDPYRKI
jgi:hypothetical protein